MINSERNIYFFQIGINPHNFNPAPGNCKIDHAGIDWNTVDLTGGFGTYAEISYHEKGFQGVNFYKADNITPLGLHDTCPSQGIPTPNGSYVGPAGLGTQWTASYLVPDAVNGSYKTVFGGWWGNTAQGI